MFKFKVKVSAIESIRKMLSDMQPVGMSDTPIYDQLEREWARQGRLGVSNG